MLMSDYQSFSFCFSSGDIYLSLGKYLSGLLVIVFLLYFFWRYNLSLDNYLPCLFVIVSELHCCKTFVILSAILLPIKSLVALAVFDIPLLYDIILFLIHQ